MPLSYRPRARKIFIAFLLFVITVLALLEAGLVLPFTHEGRLAICIAGEHGAAPFAALVKPIPLAVGVKVAFPLVEVHVPALLRAVAVSVHEAHGLRGARSWRNNPTVHSAHRRSILLIPHASVVAIALIFIDVQDFAALTANV